MILWTTVIVGWIAYKIFTTPVQFAFYIFWTVLCSLWEDVQSIVQSPTVRGFVCQAGLISIRMVGTILIFPCIIVQRLWPVAAVGRDPLVTSFHQNVIHPPHPHIPPGGEEPTVKTSYTSRGKNATCGRIKYIPPGQIYYCASHTD